MVFCCHKVSVEQSRCELGMMWCPGVFCYVFNSISLLVVPLSSSSSTALMWMSTKLGMAWNKVSVALNQFIFTWYCNDFTSVFFIDSSKRKKISHFSTGCSVLAAAVCPVGCRMHDVPLSPGTSLYLIPNQDSDKMFHIHFDVIIILCTPVRCQTNNIKIY